MSIQVADKYLHDALTDYEIKELNKDSVFVPYDQVKYYKSIDELFQGKNKAIILYLFTTNSGHYVCLFKRGKYLSFFNSYGREPDEDVLKLDPEKRKEFNETEPYLFYLMAQSNKPCEYNDTRLQSNGTSTCGWHCTHRLWYAHLSSEQYLSEIQKSVDYYKVYADKIVVSDVLPKLLEVREK